MFVSAKCVARIAKIGAYFLTMSPQATFVSSVPAVLRADMLWCAAVMKVTTSPSMLLVFGSDSSVFCLVYGR